MTSLDLLEAIGEVDEELIEELNQTLVEGKKRIGGFRRKYFSSGRGRFVAAALTACAGFILCILGNQIIQNIHSIYEPKCSEHQFAQEWDPLNPEHLQDDIVDDRSEAEKNQNAADDSSNAKKDENTGSKKKAAILGEIQLNQIDSLYANAKLGGTLKEVSEEQWQEQYGKAEFLEGHSLHEKKYYLSYSKKNDVLYGVLRMELSQKSDHKVEMIVNDEASFARSFEELKKTKIGKYEIAICQCQSGDYEGDYTAIIPDGDTFYTIDEVSDITLEEFGKLIERIFDYR